MTSRMHAYHGRDTQQVRRGNLLVAACRLAVELATSGAVLLNGSVIAQAQSIGANALAGTIAPYAGSVIWTNDPGLALITGKCADIGKVTVPNSL